MCVCVCVLFCACLHMYVCACSRKTPMKWVRDQHQTVLCLHSRVCVCVCVCVTHSIRPVWQQSSNDAWPYTLSVPIQQACVCESSKLTNGTNMLWSVVQHGVLTLKHTVLLYTANHTERLGYNMHTHTHSIDYSQKMRPLGRVWTLRRNQCAD